MSSVAARFEPKPKAVPRQPKRISLAEFLRHYSDKEDGYKYEWNNGMVEKTKTMNQQQLFLVAILNRLFNATKTYKVGGLLISEGDMNTTSSQLRKPDLAIYTAEQVKKMKKGENQIATWLAEVISPTDNADKINEKLEEYFKAGVQVVWHIFPASQQVYVYTAPDKVTICRGKTVCSGMPALPDFEISADDLFS